MCLTEKFIGCVIRTCAGKVKIIPKVNLKVGSRKSSLEGMMCFSVFYLNFSLFCATFSQHYVYAANTFFRPF
jgi:hypothetical protein